MKNNGLLIIIILSFLIVIASFNLVMIHKFYPQTSGNSFRVLNQLPLSQPTTVQTKNVRGIVTSIKDDLLTIKNGSSIDKFNIAQTADIQAEVSGSPEKGDAVSVITSKDELKVGQEVLIIVDLNTGIPKSLYILKNL